MSNEARGVYFVPSVLAGCASYIIDGTIANCSVVASWVHGEKGDDRCPTCHSPNVELRRALDGDPSHVCMHCNVCWTRGSQINICGLWHTD